MSDFTTGGINFGPLSRSSPFDLDPLRVHTVYPIDTTTLPTDYPIAYRSADPPASLVPFLAGLRAAGHVLPLDLEIWLDSALQEMA